MDPVEGHPIPQDVTGFQFRLIGDMTVKQFSYLVVGAILTWIFLVLPLWIFIRVVLAAITVLIAITLAFLPIDGRPADTMLLLFIRALIKPNQYVYGKQGKDISVPITSPQAVKRDIQPVVVKQTPPASTPVTIPPVIESAPHEIFIHNTPAPHAPLPPVSHTTTQVPDNTVLQKEVATLHEQLQTSKEEAATHAASAAAYTDETHAKALELEKQLGEESRQKQVLEERLLTLEQQINAKPGGQVFTVPDAPLESSQHVKKIPDTLKTSVGAPIAPDFPNLVTGVVKDSRGNVLSNILIEVKDLDQNPVRAFKTNQLGQFASATPLVNGRYTVTFEDPKKQQRFDTIELVASGTIIQPLEVISIDAREDLRKELFAS